MASKPDCKKSKELDSNIQCDVYVSAARYFASVFFQHYAVNDLHAAQSQRRDGQPGTNWNGPHVAAHNVDAETQENTTLNNGCPRYI